jgi:hypothetical protein
MCVSNSKWNKIPYLFPPGPTSPPKKGSEHKFGMGLSLSLSLSLSIEKIKVNP